MIKRSVRNLMALFLVLVTFTFCISVVYSQASSEKAMQILEKTFEKYSALLNRDGDIESIAARISIRGGGQVPMGGGGGSMPLDLDAAIEIYFSQPKNLYLGISGNLGNAAIVVSEKEKVTTTIILPSTKQFATIDVPDNIATEAQRFNLQEPDSEIEKIWDEADLIYEGIQQLKTGKAHKITIKAKDSTNKGSATVYILDGKWDPVGIQISEPERGSIIIEFEKLELNAKISDSQFVPNTKGYTQVKTEQLMGAVMMQIMGAMMQGGGMK